MRALLVGATGLVGSRVLARLQADPAWSEIVVLARRAVPDAGRAQVWPTDFERLDSAGRLEEAAQPGPGRPSRQALQRPAPDAALCCLGTTIRAAGSQAAFARVDRDYVLAFARLARAAGATRFAVVSALGANAASPVFYSRTKGEVERALRAMGWPSLAILRPSLLAGERAEFRPGERAALALMRPLRVLVPARLRPVPADAVAAAMVALVRRGEPGVRVVESDEIARLA